MSKAIKLEYQIKAICRLIEQGKCKNVYSATNKVKKLKNELILINRANNWNSFLSQ
jgi:hypothetical protein